MDGKKRKKKQVDEQQSFMTKFFKSGRETSSAQNMAMSPAVHQPEAPTSSIGVSKCLESGISTSLSVSVQGGEDCNTDAGLLPQDSIKDSSSCTLGISTEPSSAPVLGPWNKDECRTIIAQLFESKKVHSCFSCPDLLCSAISTTEAERLKPKKFIHSWLNRDNWWLCYVEDDGMFCIACKKHQMKHPQNKREVFSSTPGIRFKQDALATHRKSSLHAAALESEMLQKMSCFHQEFTKKEEIDNSVLEKAFAAAYFIMKEFIANRKFQPLLNFIQSVSGDDSLKYFKHRSEGTQGEIFRTIGETLKMEVVQKVKESLAFGILTDEVADISVTENLVTFIQCFCRETNQVETYFLSSQNILSNHSSADAKAISSLLLQEIRGNGLDTSKFTGFASDGASVMTGKKGGVAALLRKENPALINIHCVCHRLALSCTDSNDKIAYIKTVETLLRQLWQFFKNSPKRMAAYLKTQMELKSIHHDQKASLGVAKRLKKACRTRWLSLDASVKAVKMDFEAILQTLALFEEKDATAHGLLRRMRCYKFLGAIYILHEILPILSSLSRFFQKGSLNFSAILPAVHQTKDQLSQLKKDESPILHLGQDIDSYTNICEELKLNEKTSKELLTLMNGYVDALIQNIDRRFSDSQLVLTAFGIFDPTAIPSSECPSFKGYGETHINTLANHFFPDNIRGEKLKTQWQGVKYHIVDVVKPSMPQDMQAGAACQTPTEWLLHELLKSSGLRHFFPEVVFIAEVAASLPVSNAWPERGASALKIIKTKQRNRLGTPMLESILHVTVNGPPVDKCRPFVRRAVMAWRANKKRRNIPKLQYVLSKQPEATERILRDACMQTEAEDVLSREDIRSAMKEILLEDVDEADDDYMA